MELYNKKYSEIKQLAKQAGFEMLPVDRLLLRLSGTTANMCGEGNPNTTSSLVLKLLNYDSIM